MNTLNQKQQALNASVFPAEGVATAHRLLVLIPDADFNLALVASRAWEIAGASGAQVRFLGMCEDVLQESSLRRKLATLSALVNEGGVRADTEIITGSDWIGAVRSRRQANDMLVCLAEQRAGLLQRPLSQILTSDLDVPLTILSGLTQPVSERPKWQSQVAVWTGLFAIIIGFFLLQMRIYQTAGGWATVLMLGSLAVEYWLIWLWNSLF